MPSYLLLIDQISTINPNFSKTHTVLCHNEVGFPFIPRKVIHSYSMQIAVQYELRGKRREGLQGFVLF